MKRSPFLWYLLLVLLAGCAQSQGGQVASSTPSSTATARPTVTAPPPPTPTKAPPTPTRQEAAATQLIVDGFLDLALISGDGRQVLYVDEGRELFAYDRDSGQTTLVVSSADFLIRYPAISADGRSIAFFSAASNLADDPYQGCPPADRNICISLYVYRDGSLTKRFLIGVPDGAHISPALSADGRFVAFAASHSFIPDGHEGVFLYDQQTGSLTTIVESVPGDPLDQPSPSSGDLVAISDDGRYTAFVAARDGIVPDDRNGAADVFLYDRTTGRIDWVSATSDTTQNWQPSGVQFVPNTGGSFEAGLSISADGRFVVFMSAANLTEEALPSCQHWGWADPLPHCRHIYLYDRQERTLELVSVNDSGVPGDHASESADISADGRWVVFTSLAGNLTNDAPATCGGATSDAGCSRIYLRDRQEGKTILVSRGMGGQPPDGYSYFPVISANGQAIVYLSQAGNIAQGAARVEIPMVHLFLTDVEALLGIDQK